MPPLKICVQAVPDAVEEYLVATITEDIDSTTFAEGVISPENVDGDIVESVAPVATPAAKKRREVVRQLRQKLVLTNFQVNHLMNQMRSLLQIKKSEATARQDQTYV